MSVFRKNFSKLNHDQIVLMFEHALNVYRAISCLERARSPRPICIDSQDIIYEYIDLPDSALSFSKQGDLQEILFREIGRVLLNIHSYVPDLKLLHGDFVLHNIFFDSKTIFIIDAHPPEVLDFSLDLLYGHPAHDIWWFLFNIISSKGVISSLFEHRHVSQSMRCFMEGYKKRLSLSYIDIISFFSVLGIYYKIKRKYGVSRIKASLYCVAVGSLCLLCLGKS